MTHTQLLAQLDVYFEKYPSEKHNIDTCKHFIKHHPDCFFPSCKLGHITGSAWILNSQRDKAILTHHRKLNTWIQLGGHADGEADILSVAHREATEESAPLVIASPDAVGVRQSQNPLAAATYA